jgi:hypothetical protein
MVRHLLASRNIWRIALVLPAPVEREEIHTRTLEIKGYRRSDGLYDIEGNLTDIKPHRHQMAEEWRKAGEPIHDLWIRLTINDDFEVVDSEAGMATGAYTICQVIAPNFKNLIGLRIGPGWNKKVRERVGGVKGCTHIVEMLAQMATAAMQALWSDKSAKMKEDKVSSAEQQKPSALGTCYSWRADGPVVARYFPDAYDGPEDAAGKPQPSGPGLDDPQLQVNAD